MLNKIYLTGNLGQAPKFYTTQKGEEIAVLSVATNFSWKNDKGELQFHTDWHRITVFRDSVVRWIKESLRKGDSLLIEGKLSYTDVGTESNMRTVPCIVVSGREGQIHLLRAAHSKEKVVSKDPPEDSEGGSSHEA